MVFGFVKQSGGHVKIYSEPGEGTTVKIYLPRAVGAVTAAGQRTAVPIELPRARPPSWWWRTRPACARSPQRSSPTSATGSFRRPTARKPCACSARNVATVDLLLTDVVLPGKVRGRELAERVQALRPEVPVVFMSGYTENSIVHHGRLDEGVHLVGKPFKREQLACKVAEVLAASAAATPGAANVVALRPKRDAGA